MKETEDSVDGPSEEKVKRPDSKLDKRVQVCFYEKFAYSV